MVWPSCAIYAQHVGLGVLNKAHWLNGGGEKLLPHLKECSTHVVHGNTLTTAVVWDVLRAKLPKGAKVVLTGGTAKIGASLCQLLLSDGFSVVLLTASKPRYDMVKAQCPDDEHAARLSHISTYAEGAGNAYWVLGKAFPVKEAARCLDAETTVFEYAVPPIPPEVGERIKKYQPVGALTLADPNKTDLTYVTQLT